jgi:hypothetical protein
VGEKDWSKIPLTLTQTKTGISNSTIHSDVDITADKVRLNKLRNMISIDYFDAANCLLTFGHAI